jgi:Fe-S-cluster-containing dehydrogenase component
MRLGFLLNQETCIGCHACTVACKSEHGVPLGAFRTWVKHIEKGTFPDVKRHFSVMRCNHCDDAPCMDICPTKALFRRKDGVVDFDRDACIGCKSCLQACPYDALYIDPESNTAAKCNFCAHRLDAGLEPACVIVCPVQAIGVGDLDDPNSSLSKLVADGAVARKPELGTKPKTYYIGADAASLDPLQIEDRGPYPFTANGPMIEGEPGLIREIYDVPHPASWGWKVWSYLWTKSIAAGALLAAALLGIFDREMAHHTLVTQAAPIVALLFITITSLLLIFDLKRPERFWYDDWPNWKSWLVRGSRGVGAFGRRAGVAAGAVASFTPFHPDFPRRGRIHRLPLPPGRRAASSGARTAATPSHRAVADRGSAVPLVLAPCSASGPKRNLESHFWSLVGPLAPLLILFAASLCLHYLIARIRSNYNHGFAPCAPRGRRDLPGNARPGLRLSVLTAG